METDKDDFSDWWSIPEPILLRVLTYLKPSDVSAMSSVCKRWNLVSNDEFVWQKMFIRDFKLDLDTGIGLKPGMFYNYYVIHC